MKKLNAILAGLVCVLIFAILVPETQTAASTIPIYINGMEVKPDVAPVMRNNRVFVPLRFISENLGVLVKWDGVQQQVWLDRGGWPLNLTLGESYRDLGIDVPLFTLRGRTMVPIRAIAELMGMEVDYADGKVLISHGENSPVFRRLAEDDIIFSDIDRYMFEKDGRFYMSWDSSIIPGQHSAMLIDRNGWGVNNFLTDDDGWILFSVTGYSAAVQLLYVISPDAEIRRLTSGEINGLTRFQDEVFIFWGPFPYEAWMPLIEYNTNISRVNYRNVGAELAYVGQNGFIYGRAIIFADLNKNGIYVPGEYKDWLDVEFDFEENVFYAVGVNSLADAPLASSGFCRVNYLTNTQEKIRDLNPDEYELWQ